MSKFAVHVASELWGRNLGSQPSEASFYLEYYHAKVDCLDPGRVFFSKHCEVLDIVKFVRERRDRKLTDVEVDLAALRPVPAWLKTTDKTALWEALAFGISLWLFVDASRWQNNESLQEYVGRLFAPTSNPSSGETDVVHLTARALCHIGGIELVWTSDICEHLRLDLTDRKHPQLFLFRHGSYLSSQADAGQRGEYLGAVADFADAC